MIKTYISDIISIACIAAFAFVIAGSPRLDLMHIKTNAVQSVKKPAVLESKVQQKGRAPDTSSYTALRERNIFAENGSYVLTVAINQSLPKNPYKLIGILTGKEKKAVFREYTGTVVTVPVGKKMIDGFEVVVINSISVKLQKEAERKVFRLFNAVETDESMAAGQEKNVSLDGYVLIGTLGGQEKKAVFRNAKGAISIMPMGAQLPDGSVISSVNPLSVKFKKDKKERELRIFGADGARGK